MTDEFLEHDLDTPTEADLDLAYGSKYLGAIDLGDRKIRTRLQKVRKEVLTDKDGRKKTKFILFFDNVDKPLVLNVTNKDRLVTTLGRVPSKWAGASIGLFVDPDVSFGGKKTGGVRLKVLEPFQAKPAPKQLAKAAMPEWMEQPDDPGFDPDLNDDPDFNQARE